MRRRSTIAALCATRKACLPASVAATESEAHSPPGRRPAPPPTSARPTSPAAQPPPDQPDARRSQPSSRPTQSSASPPQPPEKDSPAANSCPPNTAVAPHRRSPGRTHEKYQTANTGPPLKPEASQQELQSSPAKMQIASDDIPTYIESVRRPTARRRHSNCHSPARRQIRSTAASQYIPASPRGFENIHAPRPTAPPGQSNNPLPNHFPSPCPRIVTPAPKFAIPSIGRTKDKGIKHNQEPGPNRNGHFLRPMLYF